MTTPAPTQSSATAPSATADEAAAGDARSFPGAVANPIRTQI